ncbi:MAG: hypothetical protein JRG77_07210 [Deltaproteobacteria bacterium]|nr:hypothetical protein [Deltaproteobacteria bacterium]
MGCHYVPPFLDCHRHIVSNGVIRSCLVVDKRFEGIDKRFEELRQDMNKRFEQVDKRFEQVDKRFEQMMNFMWILASIFAAMTVANIGFAYWDRRTIIRKAVG